MVSVSAIMIVTWTKLIFDEETSKIVTLGVLIFCTSVGFLSAVGLLKFRRKTHGENKSGYRWSKVVAASLFGIVNVVRCVIFIYKHANGSEDCADKIVGIIYNALSIFYTGILLYILYRMNVLEENNLLRFFFSRYFFHQF